MRQNVINIAKNGNIILSFPVLIQVSITDFLNEVNKMYNFNKGRKNKRMFAVICLVLVAAMLITTFVSALFVY